MSAQVRAKRRLWSGKAHRLRESGEIFTIDAPAEFSAHCMEWVSGPPPEWTEQLALLNPNAKAEILRRESLAPRKSYSKADLASMGHKRVI